MVVDGIAARFARRLKPHRAVLRMAGMAAALATASAVAQAPLDIRVALIIGNSAYADSPLVNPANDARAMSESLRALGFQVVELRDGSKAQMSGAIAKVSEALKGKRGVGMLYYAGHGLQLDWRNYMVPVDAKLRSQADVMTQTIDLGTVIETFRGAGNRMNILVLDACRNNPFGTGTSSAKGLAQIDAPPGTFLAYATAPGNVAEDGDEKGGNGLYTQYLLQELRRPAASIEDVFKRVRFSVRKQSQGRQIPWESTSLEDDFAFNDGAKFTIKPEQLERMAAEARAREAEKTGTAVQQTKEQERLAEVARQQELDRLAALNKAAAAEARLSKEQLAELAFKQSKEAWDRIKASSTPDDFYAFLQRYPSAGEFSELAQFRLDQLVKPQIQASLGQGQDAALAYTGSRFRVGDEFHIQVSDLLTKQPIEKTVYRVSSVDDGSVKFENSLLIVSPLGGTISNRRGTFDPAWGGAPVDLQVGKKWTGRTVVTPRTGPGYHIDGEAKITGRETITVPAGTFQTYVVEGVGWVSEGVKIQVKAWVDPRYGFAVRIEEVVRTTRGQVTRSEIREMTLIQAQRT